MWIWPRSSRRGVVSPAQREIATETDWALGVETHVQGQENSCYSPAPTNDDTGINTHGVTWTPAATQPSRLYIHHRRRWRGRALVPSVTIAKAKV